MEIIHDIITKKKKVNKNNNNKNIVLQNKTTYVILILAAVLFSEDLLEYHNRTEVQCVFSKVALCPAVPLPQLRPLQQKKPLLTTSIAFSK